MRRCEMRKFCQFTKETGEAVWVNPLLIRLVHASLAGSRIEFEQHFLLVNELPHAVASAVEDAVHPP
jgi:hypothetical protein